MTGDASLATAGVIVVALIGAWQNSRTRKINTSEHDRAAKERAGVQEAVLGSINLVHEEVLGLRQDLKEHMADRKSVV